MGGTGGGLIPRGTTPDDLARKIREAQENALGPRFQEDLSEFLARLLANVNDRDADSTRQHLEEIRSALESDIDGTLDLLFGGSVAKHTYVNGLSDVDALVFLDRTDLASAGPQAALDYIAERLQRRFPTTQITKGRLAVTVKFQDQEIQLLPAVRSGNRCRIADAAGEGWVTIHPEAFRERLTRVNESNASKVVPTIKLVKAVCQGLPQSRQPTGYHTECLAVDVFSDYDGPKTLQAMLPHFFDVASARVLRPVEDVTRQSVCADEYLGPSGDPRRQAISSALARIARTIKNANAVGALDVWKGLFGEDE